MDQTAGAPSTTDAGAPAPQGSFLGDTLKFEGFHGKSILKQIAHNPTRLLTGVDPASTSLWNTLLGTHNKPIVDQMGGATKQDYADANKAGINTQAGHSMQDVGHVVAGIFAANGLAGAGGGGAAATGDAASSVGTTGAGGSTAGSGAAGSGATNWAGMASSLGNSMQSAGKQQTSMAEQQQQQLIANAIKALANKNNYYKAPAEPGWINTNGGQA